LEQEEIWVNVGEINGVDYTGLYLVSSWGNVYSVERITTYANGRRKRNGGNPLKTYKGEYESVQLNKNGKGKTLNVHTLVVEAFLPNPQNKLEVNHINGIKTDNRLSNLERSTRQANEQHAYDTGLAKKGIEHPYSKLNEMRVRVILKLKGIKKQSELAYIFGIDRTTISKIKCGVNWKHINI
jgi:hypothetical protein